MKMDIGSKIKRLRILKGLTQEELADRSEVTKGYISQVENDLVSPTISTLSDLVSALGCDLKTFFNEKEEDVKIVFSEYDHIEKITDKYTINWLIPNSQKNEMEPILLEMDEDSEIPLDKPHDGEEFGYILEGVIELSIGNETYVCKKGQSFYYITDKEHKIKNINKGKSVLIWVSCPPNF